MNRARWLIRAGLLAVSVGLLAMLAARRPETADAQATWPAGAALQVSAATLDGDGNPDSVTLAWPAADGGTDNYVVRRDATVLATLPPSTLSFTDLNPTAGVTYEYTVSAVLGGSGPALGAPNVRFPATAGCALLWTGGASASWDNAANWAPYGKAGQEGAVRVPTATDAACVDVGRNLPISVTTAGQVAGSITGSLFNPVTLSVAGGDLKVFGESTIPALAMAGGTLLLDADTELWRAGGRDPLTLGGGSLQITTVVRTINPGNGIVSGDVSVLSGTTTTLDGGELHTVMLKASGGTARTLVGRGGHTLRLEAAVQSGPGLTLSEGPGGAAIVTSGGVKHSGGDSVIDWELGVPTAGPGLVVEVDGGTLTLNDFAEVDAAQDNHLVESWRLELWGKLVIGEDAREFTGEVYVGNTDGALFVGGRADPWSGIEYIQELRVVAPSVLSFDGDLYVYYMQLANGAEVVVAGELIVLDGTPEDPSWISLDGVVTPVTLRVGLPSTFPEHSVLSVRGTVDIHGDITVAGELSADGLVEDIGEFPVFVTFHDDLTFESTSALKLFLAGLTDDQKTRIVVLGRLTMDGKLVSRIPNVLPLGTDVLVIAAEDRVGAFATEEFIGDGETGSADDWDALVEDDGVHLAGGGGSGGGGDTCDPVPDVNGMATGGCWVSLGDQQWFSSLDVAPKPEDYPRIGGLTFEPGVEMTIYLDLTEPRAPLLFARDDTGDPARVAVSTRLTNGHGDTEVVALGTPQLDWVLDGSDLELGTTSFLGLRVSGNPSVSSDEAPWQLTMNSRLPAAFGGRLLTYSDELPDSGLDALSFGSFDMLFAGLAAVPSVAVEYEGDGQWSIANATVPSIDALFTMEAGDVRSGSIATSGLALLDMPLSDTVLDYVDATSRWVSRELAADGSSAGILVESVSNTIGVGSRLATTTIDFAVAIAPDGLIFERVVGGWAVEGTVERNGRPIEVSTPQLFQFSDEIATAGSIVMEGAYGTFGVLQDLTLVVTDLAVPGVDKAATIFEVTTTAVTNSGTDVVNGTLALIDGTIDHLELPVTLALGELGTVSGALRDNALGVVELVGVVTGTKPTFTCTDAAGTRVVPVEVVSGLSGGAPTAPVVIPEVCFGPWLLRDVTVEPAVAPGKVDVSANLGGAPVSGQWEMDAGNLTKGTLALPASDIGGWLPVPALSLDLTEAGGSDRFVLADAAAPGAPLRGFALGFVDGGIDFGDIDLGDIAIGLPDLADLVADAGEWLPVGGVSIEYAVDKDTWTMNGFLEQPRVSFDAELVLSDGKFVSGSVDMNVVDLGPLGNVDLRLDVTGPSSFAVVGSWQGAEFADDRTVGGSLTFADGELAAGSLQIDELPIGELFVIDDLAVTFDAGGLWTLDGVLRSDGATVAVSGALSFVDGRVTGLRLGADGVPLGAFVLDEFEMELDTAKGNEWFALGGAVRGAADTSSGVPEVDLVEFEGSAEWANGQLERFELEIPTLEIPGIAYLRNLRVEYVNAGISRLSASGQVVTADETTPAAASFDMIVDDGVLISAEITAQRLSLGGLVTIEDFELWHERVAVPTCAGASGPNTKTLMMSGTTADGAAVSGCATVSGRDLVGGELDIEQLRVGDLIRIDDFSARYTLGYFYPAQWQQPNPPASPNLVAARFDVDAVVAVGDLAPVAVTGAIELTDGGLSLFELAVPRVALSSTVELRDLTIAYAQPSRWDGVSDTSFSLAGIAAHGGGETVASGSFRFAVGGRMEAAVLSISELPLGPVTLRSFDLVYENADDETEWLIGGVVELPTGEEFELRGDATLEAGRLVAASFQIPRLSVGEMVQLSNVVLTFQRDGGDNERWFGTGGVSGLGQASDPSTALFDVTIDREGTLRDGRIAVSEVRWGGLFTVFDLELVGDRVSASQFVWTLEAELAIGDGSRSGVAGSLDLRNGVVHTGSLSLSDVQVAELLVIDLELSTATRGGSATWDAALSVLAVDSGSTASGSGQLVWRGGSLHAATLELGRVPVGELFTLDSLLIEFDTGRRWALSASITDDDGTATASGEVIFLDGRWASGKLELADLQVGPLDLQQLVLTVDSTGVLASSVCGVADPGGSGIRFGVEATVATADGDTTSLGGRFRLADGRFTEGVLCGDGIQLADMVLLDDVLLAYSQTGTGVNREVTFDGAATLVDPNNPIDSTSASVAFDIRNGQLQRLDLTADGLNLGNLISLEDVELRFDRGEDATIWEFGGTLERNGVTTTRLEGGLEIVDGTIVAGSLAADNVPVGDLFTFVDLELEFHGRRSVPDAADSPPFVARGNTTDCAAVPSDSNVPVGAGGLTGTGARFRVAASIEANDATFAVTGSLDFSNGKLTQFDVSIACLPIGDFKRIQGLRMAYRGDMFIANGRLQDPDGAPGVEAEFFFDRGRLVGGHVLLHDVPLGAVMVDEFELALGENATGDTIFGLGISVERRDGSVVGGGGSFTLRDGRMIAGSIRIDELPFLELFTLEDFEITFDNTVPGAARFAGEARIVISDGPSVEIDISLIHEDGRLVGGSFAAEAIKLFDAVPLAGFSIAYDGSLSPPQWSGSFQIGFAGNDNGGSVGLPTMRAGIEFRGGRLISALIGFDGDGDGVVDGGGEGEAPATGGGGGFGGMPLKGMYLKFCSVDAVSAYCEDELDANVWEGQLRFELPTEASPGLNAYLKIVDGQLSEASFEISGLNIPIYAGVFLQSISGNIAVYPRFAVGGGLGITIGPSVATIVAIDGYMEISEQPDPEPGSNPADYESEWIRFYTEGNANFFNLPIGLTAYGQIDTNGSVAFGGGVRLDIIDDILYVNGESGGALFNAGALGLTNPRTGEPLTGVAAQLYATAEARILGQEVASTSFYANTIGAMGCASIDFVPFIDPPWGDASVGAGIYWSDGHTKLTCDLGKFVIGGIDIGPVFNSDSVEGATRRTEAAGVAEFSEFFVAPGEPVLGVHVTGEGGAPSVTLLSPDGAIYDTDDADLSDGTLVATSPDARWFLIGQPAGGVWRVQASAGSLPLDEVTVSHLLPEVAVDATISAAGPAVAVDWTAAAIPGQQIVFLERSLDGGDGVTAAVGSGLGGAGSFTFTPAGPEGGEVRQLVAVVLQDGLPRAEVVLGTFTVLPAAPAGAPTAATATEVSGGALVTWAPPASDGGRPITAYRLMSNAGWSLTTDADVFSATLPIPALVPGEVVPVWVQAFTGAGWGDAATVTFVSTQTTSLESPPNPRVEGLLPVPTADETPPTVTVEQGVTQADPTSGTPIVFDVVFSEAVSGFDQSDVVLGGTAGASSVQVLGSGGIYRLVVTGMTNAGSVAVSIAADAAVDAAGNGNVASTSIDNTVQFAVASAPLTIGQLADIRLVADSGRSGVVATVVPPTATGGVAPVSVSCTPASGTTFRVGTTVVICTATDAVGTMRSGSFSVVVVTRGLPATGQDVNGMLATALVITAAGALLWRRARPRRSTMK